ncbi:beta-hexosaminidase [Microthyrium microscopicum]|uniref:beta-N-acetylhexosaminidase n=1 Tax=Microthyrium microscopicum TaxID=703497 RepID=A0A6A6TV05_9PEZI|nr:beta-hexosaminidase [Microthyrium microscopicum]
MFHVWITALFSGLVAGRLVGIPTVAFDMDRGAFTTNSGELAWDTIQRIVVSSKYANHIDEKGQTLIPPTLKSFAATFSSDLSKVLHRNIVVIEGECCSSEEIFLTIGDPANYLDAAGRQTSEGYSLFISGSGITITGASPLGVWWGTRTLLQQSILNNTLPFGTAVDSPGWATRGMMLDVGRHYYPPEFLVEMCSYMSFFKQNTFHLHLSDNLYNNVGLYTRQQSLDLYARFRLWSDAPALQGLNKFKNESYTQEQFEHIQSACVARGVTIIPEIEAPGHALVIVQWKPELGLDGDLSLLNISHPEAIPTMKLIWKTFLPWFHTKTVHIGADEYTGPVADYITFVNTMAMYIGEISNKFISIWGTFPPRKAPGLPKIYPNVSIQHWAYFEDNPYQDYVLANYSVLNSDDAFYVVNKWSGSYPQTVNISRTFHGGQGKPWYPYIFNMNNETDNPKRSSLLVLGEVAALWNDYGANATVYSEAYYAWREGIPALADKQWGGNLTEAEFYTAFMALHPFIPDQNLDRSVESVSNTILEYQLPASLASQETRDGGGLTIKDLSGNGYHAKTTCSTTRKGSLEINPSCSLVTPLYSKGRNYTLTIKLKLSSLTGTYATLISGPDSALILMPNITFLAAGNYFSLNATLPVGEVTELTIAGQGSQTFAYVNGTKMEFLAVLGINGVSLRWESIGIEAPLHVVGGDSGWTGEISGMKLTLWQKSMQKNQISNATNHHLMYTMRKTSIYAQQRN